MGYHEAKRERDRALIDLLHPASSPGDEPPADPEGAPDFDGGVREPAPVPSDPEHEHTELILDLVRQAYQP